MDSAPPRPPLPLPWQGTIAAQWLALLLGIVPMYGLAILSGVFAQGKPFQVPTTFSLLAETGVELVVFGGGMVLLLYLVCGERLSQLQWKTGFWATDLGTGALLWLLLFAAMIGLKPILKLAGAPDVPEANQLLGTALAHDPVMLAVFIGPVIWLKAAVLEELSRVFMLTRLWRIFPQPGQRIPVLVASSLLFGAGHLWEGWQGVAATSLIGLILGWNYMRNGRVLPLMFAHGLFDTLATVALVAVGSGAVQV